LLISRKQWEFQTRRGQQYRPRVVPKKEIAVFGMKKSLEVFLFSAALAAILSKSDRTMGTGLGFVEPKF